MSARLRASAYPSYTAQNVGRSRIRTAIIEAAGAWYEARRNVTDCENALADAVEHDNAMLMVALEYARLDAVAHREHAYWQVYTLACGGKEPDEWEDVASNGVYFCVRWGGAEIGQISILVQDN
jgi:hypothetical protein